MKNSEKSKDELFLNIDSMNLEEKKKYQRGQDALNMLLETLSSTENKKPNIIVNKNDVLPYMLPQLPDNYDFTKEADQFFPQKMKLPDFQYVLKISFILNKIIQNNYSTPLQNLKSLEIAPVLCKDNILYDLYNAKTRQVSLDLNQPCFMSVDLIKKTARKLPWEEVEDVIKNAIANSNKAEAALEKLSEVYETAPNSVPPQKTLPNVREVYTHAALRAYYKTKIQKDKYFPSEENVCVLPVLCESNCIFSKQGTNYYQISLEKDNIGYHRLTQDQHYLMTENELHTTLYNLKLNHITLEQENDIKALLRITYKNDILPFFEKDTQLSYKNYMNRINLLHPKSYFKLIEKKYQNTRED